MTARRILCAVAMAFAVVAAPAYAKPIKKNHHTSTVAEAAMSVSPIVNEARRYIGASAAQLGLRRSLWCGAFMDMVLKRTGHRGGGNLARSYARYGIRVGSPQVGALAVMARGKGGGHVGVVSGLDAEGNVIVVSGNHNNTVAESVYPRSRIFAYVMPEG
jgi:uncharacterized protein (TIGR02594 family)